MSEEIKENVVEEENKGSSSISDFLSGISRPENDVKKSDSNPLSSDPSDIPEKDGKDIEPFGKSELMAQRSQAKIVNGLQTSDPAQVIVTPGKAKRSYRKSAKKKKLEINLPADAVTIVGCQLIDGILATILNMEEDEIKFSNEEIAMLTPMVDQLMAEHINRMPTWQLLLLSVVIMKGSSIVQAKARQRRDLKKARRAAKKLTNSQDANKS